MSDTKNETRDGFSMQKDKFEFQQNFGNLAFEGRRAGAICDMFVNSGFSVETITNRFQEDNGRIVRTLIVHGIIKDRRMAFADLPSREERRCRLPAWAYGV